MKKWMVITIAVLLSAGTGFAKGEWEIGFHVSTWSINIVGDQIEEEVIDQFDNYDASKGDLNFNSNGSNLGLAVRFYPAGKHGSFSIGLSYERNNFKGDINGDYEERDSQGNRATVVADGFFDFRPHSFNFSFRWDLWPRAVVHPYFSIGFGIGPLNGNMGLTTVTTTNIGNVTVIETDKEEMTLKEAIEEYEEEEGKKFPISFFPIVYVSLGVKGEVANNIYLTGEFAFYDGISFRGGLAVRF